jgi:endo-1,4-beta-xylanase
VNVSLTPASWNLAIPAGGSVTVGMLGRWTTKDAPPTSAQLNGFPCTLS